jgi:hypothetical protein
MGKSTMSMPKYNRRPDTSQADIVKGLRAAGYGVEIQGKPVDLRIWHHGRWGLNRFVEIETKTLYGKRVPKIILDPRQKAQADYCATHGVPYCATLDEAMSYLRSIPDSWFEYD